ncbi:MAG: response regulator transcription factor [Chloroflexota bacterium]|nr:response regulator transcription factor [Chloroflexota bacterium]
MGLRVLLDQAPNVEVVGEAEDGEEALAQIEALQPDVVVLDCQLPEMSGPEVAAEIKRRGLPTKVLAPSTGSGQASAPIVTITTSVGCWRRGRWATC